MDRVGSSKLSRLIESSGTVELYEATDERLGRKVRVRILASGATEEEKLAFEKAAREEARTGLSTAPLHELGRTADGRPYVVTGVPGGKDGESGREKPGDKTLPAAPIRGRWRVGRIVLVGLAFCIASIVVLAAMMFSPRSEPVTKRPFIAVMPFVGMALQEDSRWIAAAACESLMTALAREGDLAVMDRESADFASGLPNPGPALAKVGCAWMLDGDMASTAAGYKLAVRVRSTSDGTTLFAKAYALDRDGCFASTDEVARSVVSGVGARLAPRTKARDPYAGLSPEAWSLAMKARSKVRLARDLADAMEANDMLKRALAIEPRAPILYVDLLAGLRDAMMKATDAPEIKARIQADFDSIGSKAADLLEGVPVNDSSIDPGAYCQLAGDLAFYDGDIVRGHSWYEKLVELHPCDAVAVDMLATATSDVTERYVLFDREQVLNPFSRDYYINRSFNGVFTRRYADGITTATAGLVYWPDDGYLLVNRGLNELSEGKTAEAKADFEAAENAGGPFATHAIAYMKAIEGRTEEARAFCRSVQEEAERKGTFTSFWIPLIYAELGDIDEAFRTMEWTVNHGDTILPLMRFEPWELFDGLRTDSRYAEILKLGVKKPRAEL